MVQGASEASCGPEVAFSLRAPKSAEIILPTVRSPKAGTLTHYNLSPFCCPRPVFASIIWELAPCPCLCAGCVSPCGSPSSWTDTIFEWFFTLGAPHQCISPFVTIGSKGADFQWIPGLSVELLTCYKEEECCWLGSLWFILFVHTKTSGPAPGLSLVPLRILNMKPLPFWKNLPTSWLKSWWSLEFYFAYSFSSFLATQDIWWEMGDGRWAWECTGTDTRQPGVGVQGILSVQYSLWLLYPSEMSGESQDFMRAFYSQ